MSSVGSVGVISVVILLIFVLSKRSDSYTNHPKYSIKFLKIMKLITLLLSVTLFSVGLVSCSTEPEATVEITDTVVGSGAVATSGKYVTVHYVGTLTNGSKFDSSRDRFQPFSFTLGAGKVIQGWEKGIPGMKVGGIRKLVIPSSLGYGSVEQQGIPANSTLIFDVELLSVK